MFSEKIIVKYWIWLVGLSAFSIIHSLHQVTITFLRQIKVKKITSNVEKYLYEGQVFIGLKGTFDRT